MTIGSVSVEKGVLLAPMEDVTDLPFRVICKRNGADIVYTEFISSEGLVRDAKRSLAKLELAEEEQPSVIQIFGGDIPTMIRAAEMAVTSNPAFLDINCGCWVKNVVARNAGAGLLREPHKMAEMTKAIVEAVAPIPVTVKTRLGWDPKSIIIVDVAQMLEQAGAAALTIHCRTRDMGHRGEADWSWVEKVKKFVQIPVILNGDVTNAKEAKRAFDETGADAVMIGRAAIGNPFIFSQSRTLIDSGVEATPPSVEERVAVCLEHYKLSIEKTGKRAIHEFRKHFGGYLKGLYNSAPVRQEIVRMDSYDNVVNRLSEYVVYMKEIGKNTVHTFDESLESIEYAEEN